MIYLYNIYINRKEFTDLETGLEYKRKSALESVRQSISERPIRLENESSAQRIA